MTCAMGGACLDMKCPTKWQKILSFIDYYVCKTIFPIFFSITPEICSIGLVGITTSSAIFLSLSNKTSIAHTSHSKAPLDYKPITKEQASSFYPVPVATKMLGDAKLNNSFIAQENGSHIWSKNFGYIVLSDKPDNVYASLCSSKFITVKNYNKDDTIWFFCTKKTPSISEIVIEHKEFNGEIFTSIEVRNEIAVYIEGDVNPHIGITNKTYVDSIFNDDIM